jgi:hypothetical protein
MTPKEKAEELILRFDNLDNGEHTYHYVHNSKKCALIAVNQILEIIYSDYDWQYWYEVKQEIEKL